MGDGTVKFAGYRTEGKVKHKGPGNKRNKKMRLKKEEASRERMARQRKREEREDIASEWNSSY